MPVDHQRHTAPTGLAVALLVLVLAMAAGAVAVSRGWNAGDGLNWSSLVGTVIGATIAIIAIGESRKQRLEEKEQRDIVIAMSLLFKLIKISSDFANIAHYFTTCIDDEPRQRGLDGEPWAFYRPLASMPDTVHFSSEEMVLLLSLREDALFQKCTALDEIHNSFFATMLILNAERIELDESIEPTHVEGDLSRFELMPTPRQRLRMNSINSLIERLRKWAASDEERSGTSVDEASALFRRRLGTKVRTERRGKPDNIII